MGGTLLCQHRALLRKECRNVHFALVATRAPALQLAALKCLGSGAADDQTEEHQARRHVCCCAEEWADNEETEGRQKRCICCGTIGVTSSALHGPVIRPPPFPCVPLRPCEMLSSRKPAQQNRQAQRCTHSQQHNNISHHHSPSWHMHIETSAENSA